MSGLDIVGAADVERDRRAICVSSVYICNKKNVNLAKVSNVLVIVTRMILVLYSDLQPVHHNRLRTVQVVRPMAVLMRMSVKQIRY